MSKSILLCISFVFLILGCKEYNLHQKKQVENNNLFKLPSNYVVESSIRIDFDNNSIDDFIYIAYSEEELKSKEFWVTDNQELFLKVDDIPSQNYHYFMNLDNGSEQEVIIIRGEEDYSNAKISKINLDKKSLDTIFYFNPVVYKDNKYYWAYYWDIKKLILNNKKEIYSSYTTIPLDSEKIMLENQESLPVLIFSPNNSFDSNNSVSIKIEDAQYRSINNIKKFAFDSKKIS